MVIDFRRKNAPGGVATITLGSNPDRDYGYLGVSVLDAPWAPFTIDFNLANIGGPSAGLMFSLAVIDKLTTGDLNGSKFVAGTGTIDTDGKVGPIGGITHKMQAAHDAGATVFLVPAENCDEARTGQQDGLELVKVGTLVQAVDALQGDFSRWRTATLLTDGPRSARHCLRTVGAVTPVRHKFIDRPGVNTWGCGPPRGCRS